MSKRQLVKAIYDVNNPTEKIRYEVTDLPATGEWDDPIHIPVEGIRVEEGKWYYVESPFLARRALVSDYVPVTAFGCKLVFSRE